MVPAVSRWDSCGLAWAGQSRTWMARSCPVCFMLLSASSASDFFCLAVCQCYMQELCVVALLLNVFIQHGLEPLLPLGHRWPAIACCTIFIDLQALYCGKFCSGSSASESHTIAYITPLFEGRYRSYPPDTLQSLSPSAFIIQRACLSRCFGHTPCVDATERHKLSCTRCCSSQIW